jgi:hypothetical protein
MVASFDDPAGLHRPDDRRAQRPSARAGVRDENMVGHKLGEFALTRTFKGHAADKKAKK